MSRRSVLVGVVSAAMVASGLVGVNTAAWAQAQAGVVEPAVGVAAADAVPPGADAGSWPKNSYASSSMVRLNAEQSAVAGAMYLAQRDNKEVPIPEFTSETIQAWARPDGTVHEETAAAPVRAKVDGAWQNVDATLVKGGDGVWRPKVSAVAMAFSGGGAGPVATLSRDGVSIAYTFPEALPTPSVDGTSLTYPNVYPGVDLVVTASSSTFSQVLVIKDKAAAKNPKVRVVRVKTAVKGGTLVGGKDGGYAVNNAKGQPVLTGAAPLAWDSTSPADQAGKGAQGRPEVGRKVGHPAPGVGNRQKPVGLRVEDGAITVSAPVELLDDPGTVFPVSVDPTVSLANTRWFMVDNAYPNQQYANYTGSSGSTWGPNEAAGYNDYSGVHVKRLFFEFSNARLAGKTISYATFNAFEAFSATCDTTAGNNAYILNTEIGTPVTWNSQPTNMTQSYGTYTAKTNPTACNNGKRQGIWDITAAVRGRQAANTATTTVVLKGSNEASNSSWMRWLDPTTGAGNAPILAADYAYTSVPALADLNAAAPGVGMQSWYPVEEFAVRENLSLAVNVANGNVMVRDTDLTSSAPGAGVRLDRWYNSLSTATGTFGQAWKLGVGSDVRLVEDASIGTVYLVGPSGFIAKWVNTAGVWKADPGLNASLAKYSDGTYRVKAQSTGMIMDFGASGMLGNILDGNGVGLSFYANPDGTTKQIMDAAGRKVDFAYAAGRASSITQTGTDGATRATAYTYNAAGRLATSRDADNNTTTYGYDGSGRLNSIITARGVKVTVGYDGAGRAGSVSRWDDAGVENKWTFTYPSGTQTQEIDPHGMLWKHTLDATKKRTAVTEPYGTVQSQAYTANNTIATTTDAMGSGGTGGNVMTFSYDSANNPTQVKVPTGAISTLAYGTQAGCGSDGTGAGDKVTCATDPAGNKTGMTWDAAGNLTSSTSGSGSAGAATTTYTYQATTGATGSDTACGGKKGQVCTATQPLVAGQSSGWKVTNAYDSYGNLTSSTGSDPTLLGARTFTYDGFGRVKTATDGKGAALTYAWDNRDHVTAVSGAKSISYSWDADGNQTGNDGASMTYDKQNRQTSLTVAGKTTRASYEANGNLASYTDDTGAVTTYAYFAHNRVAAIGIGGAACNWGRNSATYPWASLTNQAQAGCVKFSYNNNALETARVYPGGVIQSRAIDASSRIFAVSSQVNNAGALLTSQGYSFNSGGDKANVQSWNTYAASLSPGPANGASQTFTCDSLNRVTKVTETGGTAASWTYTWDQMGNRTSVTRTGASGATGNETATYNKASMLTSNSYGSLSYDKNGNELSAPAGPTGSGVPARTGEVTDAVGNTTSMTVNGTGLGFGYGGTNPGMYNQLLSAHGSTYVRSILGLALSSQVVGGKTIRYVTHPSGVNIGYGAPEGQAWFLTDRLGTVIGLASNSGSLIASYSYDPTGIPRATSETGTAAGYNIHRYAGGLLDKTTGLTRFGVRWYNPATGRFTTPDPSGKEKNTYLYAGGNTCNKTDPIGEAFGACFGAAIGLGLGGVVIGLAFPPAGAAAVSVISTIGGAIYGEICEDGPPEPNPYELRRSRINPSNGSTW